MSNTTQFPCPSCGYVYTRTTETNRARSEIDTRRKRKCLKCKSGFVTYEIRAADYNFLQSMRKWIAEPASAQPQDAPVSVPRPSEPLAQLLKETV